MKITAPDAANMAGEVTTSYGATQLTFRDGVADFDGELPDSVRSYMLMRGYDVGGETVDQEAPDPMSPLAEPADPRDTPPELVGTALRDAAVDPAPVDFLAPVNAGKDGPEGNPHGSNVVSPGIHAEGERVVRPGPVASDPDEQESAEKDFASALLIDNADVPEQSTAGLGLDWKETGPLDLSDPGSVDAGVAAAEAEKDFADGALAEQDQAPVDAGEPAREQSQTPLEQVDKPEGEPKGNATREEWVAYAKGKGANDLEVAPVADGGLSRDDLRAQYGS